MKRSLFRVVCLAGVVAALLLSHGVALAGFDWYGECPPRSASGFAHASDRALAITEPIVPPANDNAWAATNPGNKAKTK